MIVRLLPDDKIIRDIQYLGHKSDDTLVLRTSNDKKFIQPDEYTRYTVSNRDE